MLKVHFVEMNYPMVDGIEWLHDDQMVRTDRRNIDVTSRKDVTNMISITGGYASLVLNVRAKLYKRKENRSCTVMHPVSNTES